MKIRYPTGNIFSWRIEEKRRLFTERGHTCERCGLQMATDLDEGIVTRGNMRGFSQDQKRLAFASCNLFLLCADCNRNQAHQREWAFGQSCRRYGENKIREWYASLGLKAPELRFMP